MIIQPNSLDIIKHYDTNTRFYQTSQIVTKIWSATADLLGKNIYIKFPQPILGSDTYFQYRLIFKNGNNTLRIEYLSNNQSHLIIL